MKIAPIHETQRMRQWWVWLIVLGCNGLFWYAAWSQWVMGKPWGNNPAPDWLLLLILIPVTGLLLLAIFTRLETQLDHEGIHVQLFPLHIKPRFYAWRDVDQAGVRQYCPIAEYGGWGIRGLSRANRAYSVSGNYGIQLIMKNGHRLLIGTRKPLEMEQEIEKLSELCRFEVLHAGK